MIGMKCVLCGHRTKRQRVEVVDLGHAVGAFRADVCAQCGERYYSEETMRAIQAKERELGLFGLETTTEIAQYGNSLAIRIKKAVAEFLNLRKGQKVLVHPVDSKRIQIEIIG